MSSTTPKLKIQLKYSWHERGYFIRDIISPRGVNKSDIKQASSEFTHASPFLVIIIFWHFGSLPLGVTALLQPQEGFAIFWQRKRVAIIAINSLNWGIDGWRKKNYFRSPYDNMLQPSVVFACKVPNDVVWILLPVSFSVLLPCAK